MNGHVRLAPNIRKSRLLKGKGIELQCLNVASKTPRRTMMMMLRGGTASLLTAIDNGEGCQGRREGVGSVNQGRLRMCPIGCWSVMCGAQKGNLSCSA